MNTVNVIGRLTQDVELRYTKNGKAIASATIAVDGAGEYNMKESKNDAGFFKVIQWGDAAVNFANYCKKGRKIGIQGRLQQRTFEGDKGRQYIVEIVASHIDFLEEPKQQGAPQPNQGNQQQRSVPNNQPPNNNQQQGYENFNQNLPF